MYWRNVLSLLGIAIIIVMSSAQAQTPTYYTQNGNRIQAAYDDPSTVNPKEWAILLYEKQLPRSLRQNNRMGEEACRRCCGQRLVPFHLKFSRSC